MVAGRGSAVVAGQCSEGMLRSLLLAASLAASTALAPTLTPTSPGGGAQAPPPATGTQSALLDSVEEAASICLSKQRGDGREGGLAWCDEPSREALERTIRGLRGRKLAWWLDTPLPLRAAYTRGPRLDISVVALPGGTTLPASAYPSGALILVAPLLGQAEVLTLTGGAARPEELARTALRAEEEEDVLLDLEGGASHEFRGTPGVASAFLQVVLLPPSLRFPGSGAAAPPLPDPSATADAAAADDDADVTADADEAGAVSARGPQAIDVAVSDLLRVERPLPGGWESTANPDPNLNPTPTPTPNPTPTPDRNTDNKTLTLPLTRWESTGGGAGTAMPDDAPQLLARLASKVGGLDG